jgi:hypothetical protein|tara:strand:- start:2285 stop:2608 length:324 start_codon:yes stop_codon:yes gene_type:complete
MSGDEENDKNEEDLVGKNDVNSNLDPEIEGLIRDALKTLVQEKFDSRKTDDDIEAMVSTCSEFMKCFVIMGYDFKGNSIKPVFYAKNDIDSDALTQYIQKFIMNSIH